MAYRVLDDFDHSIISPNGRVSNRARRATLRQLAAKVQAAVDALPPPPQPSERQRILWRLRDVRGWYAGGMHPRLFKKEIAVLEARLAELPDLGETA